MPMTEHYIKIHKSKGLYCSETQKNGYTSFSNRNKWTDYIIDNNLVYSHRTNKYTRKNFSEGLHSHEYYELVIYINGNVEYINDNMLIKPQSYSVIWFLPGQMHTATLLSSSNYERYVFYFSKEFFAYNNIIAPMTSFMYSGKVTAFNPDAVTSKEIQNILEKIDDEIISENICGGLIAKALIIEMFGIFNKSDADSPKCTTITDNLMQIKNYIDNEYAFISTSADIAEKFHYSREHISRKFKDKFNISISEYISKRRVLESLPLLFEMSGADAAYTVGFRSQSSYISAFVKNMGCLPSEYKKTKSR